MQAPRSRYGGLLLGTSTQRSGALSLSKMILMGRLFASSPEIEAARERRKKIERAQVSYLSSDSHHIM